MKVLFVVPYVPSLIRVRPYNLVRHLTARGHHVTVATVWTNEREREDVDGLRALCAGVIAEPLHAWRSAVNCLGAVLTRDPLQARYSWSPALAARVRAAAGEADVVHVEHLRGARYGLALKKAGVAAPIVWDSVDCISDLFAQAAETRPDLAGRMINRFELPRTRRFEARTVPAFDHVAVSSPIDRSSLLRLARQTERTSREPDITVVPNGVDLRYFTVSDAPREANTLVFSGKMSYHANEAAVVHLLDHIMPRVWSKRPEARLLVVGKDPSREVQRRGAALAPRVAVTGMVPDIRAYLRGAAIAVAPLVYGAGSQYKVLEAMALATPVVAVPRAVAPLDALPGRDVVVAGDGQAFADAVVSLLDDEGRRRTVGRAGRAFVERQHDWNRIAGDLEGIYDGVLAERRRTPVSRSARVVDDNARAVLVPARPEAARSARS